MRATLTLSALLLGASSVDAAAQIDRAAPGKQSGREGELTGEPLFPTSPLDPLPILREGARHVVLPAPTGPIPMEVVISLVEGGGTITLLAPWRRGWLVGTDAGEWGGSLYTAAQGKRVMLARGNVIGGFTWRGYIYILSGVQHLGLDRGELWEVDLNASRLVRRIPLPAKPHGVILTKDGVILRTRLGDVALLRSGKVVPPTTH